VIADPDVEVFELEAGSKGWLIISSDGLNANEERGGGGGIDNDKVRKPMHGTSRALLIS